MFILESEEKCENKKVHSNLTLADNFIFQSE